jgi:hypothetical protein
MSRNWAIGLACGGIGVVLGALIPVGRVAPPAAAQAGGAAPGRYQIATWHYGTNISGSYGAYIVDQQTGDVYAVSGQNKPDRLGTLGK